MLGALSTFQRPDDLIYVSPLFSHAVFTLDTVSSSIFSVFDATNTTNLRILMLSLDEYTFSVCPGVIVQVKIV